MADCDQAQAQQTGKQQQERLMLTLKVVIRPQDCSTNQTLQKGKGEQAHDDGERQHATRTEALEKGRKRRLQQHISHVEQRGGDIETIRWSADILDQAIGRSIANVASAYYVSFASAEARIQRTCQERPRLRAQVSFATLPGLRGRTVKSTNNGSDEKVQSAQQSALFRRIDGLRSKSGERGILSRIVNEFSLFFSPDGSHRLTRLLIALTDPSAS